MSNMDNIKSSCLEYIKENSLTEEMFEILGNII